MCCDKYADIEADEMLTWWPTTFVSFSSSSLIILKSDERLRHGSFRHRYSSDPARLGLPSDTTSPAPPEGNGGRKNVEGGSEDPPGGLLDWEGERWADDNGGEARAWESPQGDLHSATRWLRLSAPSWGLHRFSKVIPSKSSPLSASPPSLLTLLSPLPLIVDTQAGDDELARRVRTSEGVLSTPLSLVLLWRSQPCLVTVALVATDTCSAQRRAAYIFSKRSKVQPAEFWRKIWGIAFLVVVCCLLWFVCVEPFTWLERLLRHPDATKYYGFCNSLLIHCSTSTSASSLYYKTTTKKLISEGVVMPSGGWLQRSEFVTR